MHLKWSCTTGWLSWALWMLGIWVGAKESKHVGETLRVCVSWVYWAVCVHMSYMCVCTHSVCAQAPNEYAAPCFWINWGRSESGAIWKQKQSAISASEMGISNSLHFLSHKICKNNAIIFILKIQLWVLLALKLYFKKHRNLREKLKKAFCFDIFRVMFYCIDDVSVEETVILEFRSVSVFYKYFFKTELQLCQANIMNWIKFVFEFTSCIFCCMWVNHFVFGVWQALPLNS